MIAIDTNILIYAHRGESVFHAEAFQCLTNLAEGVQSWGIPDACLHAREQHWTTLSRLAKAARLVGGQFHEARIAAICIENGVSEFWTADRDFSRFPGLETRNPLLHQP